MRALAVVAACSGCVISAPDGAPQFWPPGLGGTVEAVIAGDLDANDSTDIVVIQSGTDRQAGLYLIDGDDDLEWGTSKIVRSFSQFAPMAISHPVGAYLDLTMSPPLSVVSGRDTLTLTQLANNLDELDSAHSTVPSTGSLAWTRPLSFPGGVVHHAVSNGAAIEQFDGPSLADPRPIPPPAGAPSWNLAQLATSYTTGTTTTIVVATTEGIVRAALPTTPGTPFVYETVRSGPPWLGQITHDFDGDGRDEIVGFDAQAHDICVVDPGSAVLPVTPSCIHLQSKFTGTDVTMIAGVNLSMEEGLDILVAQATGTETSYSLAQDVTYLAPTISATMVVTMSAAGPARGKTVIARPSIVMPYSVLTFGTEGQVVCVLGPC